MHRTLLSALCGSHLKGKIGLNRVELETESVK